jgi:hypothetical protein
MADDLRPISFLGVPHASATETSSYDSPEAAGSFARFSSGRRWITVHSERGELGDPLSDYQRSVGLVFQEFRRLPTRSFDFLVERSEQNVHVDGLPVRFEVIAMGKTFDALSIEGDRMIYLNGSAWPRNSLSLVTIDGFESPSLDDSEMTESNERIDRSQRRSILGAAKRVETSLFCLEPQRRYLTAHSRGGGSFSIGIKYPADGRAEILVTTMSSPGRRIESFYDLLCRMIWKHALPITARIEHDRCSTVVDGEPCLADRYVVDGETVIIGSHNGFGYSIRADHIEPHMHVLATLPVEEARKVVDPIVRSVDQSRLLDDQGPTE